MKLYSADTQAALESGDNLVSGAVEILCDPPFRVFGGYGEMEIDGETFTGIGDRGLVQVSGQSLGGTSQAISLALSGIEQAVADLVDTEAAQGAPVVLRRLICNGAGTSLFDASVYARGKVDALNPDDTPAGTSTVTAAVETAARTLGRKGGRMRTDADQRLIKGDDGGFRSVSYAASKTLYWAGQRPSAASTALTSNATQAAALAAAGA